MAMSLEAAIAVPICIIAFSFALSQAVPAYMKANTAAALSAQAISSACKNRSIYASRNVLYRSSFMTAVSTSPDGVIDIIRLGRDIMRPLGNLFDEEVMTHD